MRRLIVGLALVFARATSAQELPPQGTYHYGEVKTGPDFKWRDPKNLPLQQRLAMETLLRDAHDRRMHEEMGLRSGVTVKEARARSHLSAAKLVSCSIDRASPECAALTDLWLNLTKRWQKTTAPAAGALATPLPTR